MQVPLNKDIITRREIEPLLLKAYETIKIYEKATETYGAILDQRHHSIEIYDYNVSFCDLCKKYHEKTFWDKGIYPCTGMHLANMDKVREAGGSYIYMCELGLMYWISPLFSNGRFAGTIVAAGVLGIPKKQTAEKIVAMSKGAISEEQALWFLIKLQEKEYEDIKALARMLLVCAEQISRDTGGYGETMSRMTQQEYYLSNQIRQTKMNHSDNSFGGCHLDQERMLVASLRRGDNETGRKILNEMLSALPQRSESDFALVQLRAIEMVVLLSRAAVAPDVSEDNALLEANNRYLKRIQETRNIEELTGVIHTIVDRMAGQIFSFQGVRHASALRKAERFIWENYTRKISLQEVAEVSGLSAPYFSTIFKEEMGENLSACLNRLRMEKAAAMLKKTALPLGEIVRACGFEDQSWFSKIFKDYMGMSPGKYRGQETL
ncbi:MAG: helix-turn-helix domain-containing protein [Treponema sp.]|nr:helix-turn-helix domain-containing protein [Treponema sp.]